MARIIGTASVKVTLDSTGFKSAAEKDVGDELRSVGDSEWLQPGLKKNEDATKKSSINIQSIFSSAFAAVKTSAISYLASLVPAAGNSILQLSGLLALIPAAAGAGVAVLGTLALGFHGVGAAIKDMGDPAKFAKDIAGLAPSAQDFAKGVQSLSTQFKGLQLSVQQALFLNLGSAVRSLGAQYLPILRTGLTGIAGALNGLAGELVTFFSWPAHAADVATFLDRVKTSIQLLQPAFAAVLRVFDDLISVGGNFLPQLASWISNAAQRLGTFVDKARGTGQLAAFIQTAIDALHNLATIVGNVGAIVIKLLGALDTTGGTLFDILANLTGQLRDFLNSAAGTQFLHALQTVLGAIAQNVGPIFLTLLQQLVPIVVQLAPFVAQLANTIGVLLIGALKIVGPILTAVATVLNNTSGIVIPLAVAVGGLFLAWKAFQAIQTVLTFFTIARDALYGLSIAEGIAEVATIAFNAVLDANPIILIGVALVALTVLIATHWKQTLALLTTVWNTIKSVAETVWGAISRFFTSIFSSVASVFSTVWGAITGFFIGIWNTIFGVARTVWTAITGFLIGAWNSIVNATRPIWEPIVHIIGDIFSIIRSLIIIVVDGIAILLIAAWKGIVAVAQAIWTPLAAFFSALWSGIETVAQAIWGAIVIYLEAWWIAIMAAYHNVIEPIGRFFADLWSGISAVTSAVWGAVSGFLSGVWNAIVGVLHAVFAPVGSFFAGVWNAVTGVFRSAWGAISGAVSSGIDGVMNWIRGIGGRILGALGDVGGLLLHAGEAIIEGFLHGLESAFDAVKNFVGGIANWVSSHKGPLSYDAKLLTPHGSAIMQSLIDGMAAKMAPLTSFLSGVTSQIVSSFSSTSVDIGNLTGTVVNGVSAQGGSSSGTVINAYQLPGQDVLQFASAVSRIGATAVGNGSSTIPVSQQPVNIGATNNLVSAGALA